MKITLKVGERSLTATLIDSKTAQDFVSLLPLALTMNDLFGREKLTASYYQAIRPWHDDQCGRDYHAPELSSHAPFDRPAVHARGLVHVPWRAPKSGDASARTKA